MKTAKRAIEITVNDRIFPSPYALTSRKITAIGQDRWGRIEVTHVNATGAKFTNDYAPEECITVQ